MRRDCLESERARIPGEADERKEARRELRGEELVMREKK